MKSNPKRQHEDEKEEQRPGSCCKIFDRFNNLTLRAGKTRRSGMVCPMSCFRGASIFLLSVGAVCTSAQEGPSIRVRVIDVTTGAPSPHKMIFIERVNPDTHSPIVESGMPLKGRTDIDGRVSFPAEPLRSYQAAKTEDKERLSKYRDIEIIYASGGIQCSPGIFSLDEILSTGMVDDNRCQSKVATSKFKSAPGEVVIFVGKYHWWQSGQT